MKNLLRILALLLVPFLHSIALADTFTIQTGYYVGDGADDRAITGVGFSPDLILIKEDTTAGTEGIIFKTSVMTGELSLTISEADANLTTNHIQSIDADGFTIGNDADVNTANTVYSWIAFGGSDCSASGTFCVDSYIGDGTASKSITSVGFTPDLVVAKRAAAIAGMWKSSAMSGTASNYFDLTAELASGGINSLDATGFTVGNNAAVNVDSALVYFFAFKQVAGALDVGTYTGNGVINRNITSTDDAGLTFRPDFAFIKPNTIVAAIGNIRENYGDRSFLFSDAGSAANHIKQLLASGGFQLGNSTSVNANTIPYYYAAFAGAVTKPAGSGSFKMANGTYTGTGGAFSVTGLDFSPDLIIIKDNAAQQSAFRTSLMIGDRTAYLASATTVFAGGITAINSDGFSIGASTVVNTNTNTYYWTAFGNAIKPDKSGGSSDFLVGQYLGTGNDDTNVDRLAFQPDLVTIKPVAATTGMWRTSDQVGDQALFFSNVALVPNGIQSILSDGFQKGTRAEVNTSAVTYDYFAFKESSRFAANTYTGSGASINRTNAGLQPSYLWIKKTTGGTARDGVMRTSAQAGDAAQPFRNVATIANGVTALLSNGFTVNTAVETNENTFNYQYAVWESKRQSQSTYRFFQNADSTDVGAAIDAQDTPITLAATSDALRLRLLLRVDQGNLAISEQAFKLQFVDKGTGTCTAPANGTPATYTDVTNLTAIAYNTNPTPTNGDTLTSNVNDPTDAARGIENQTYVTQNNFTNTVSAISDGESAKWDFSLVDNDAAPDTTYCLRAVRSNNTLLDTYLNFPEVTTAPDIIDPDVEITSSEATATSISPIPITIEFSEDVTGFVVGDLTVGNGTAGSFVAVDGNTYTASITPTAEGSVTVDIASAVAQDASANDNTVATQFAINYDVTDPTVSISSTEGTATNTSPIPITIEFNENVTGFVLNDVTIGNGTGGNFVAVDGNTYTLDVTPSAEGDVTIDVAADVAIDAAENDNVAALQFTIDYDISDPTLSLTPNVSDPTSASPFVVTFAFNEPVTGFAIGDIVVSNAATGNFATTNSSTYTVEVTPTVPGVVTVDVAAAVAQDTAGNDNTIATQLSLTYDPNALTVLITSAESNPTNNSPFEVTITFNEDVTGFVVGDITVGNGAAGNFNAVSGSIYTADITPSGDGSVTIDVAAAVAEDGDLNDNLAAAQYAITYDSTAPTVVVSSAAGDPTRSSPIPIAIDFDEDVTGFVIGDITVGNGNAGSFVAVDGNSYTASITPSGQGAVTVDIAGSVAIDTAGNQNSAATQFSITFDTVSPTVTIDTVATDPTTVSPIPVTIEFDEDVTGFVIGDITVGNGTAGNFVAVDASSYTVDITPTVDGVVTVDIAGSVAQDAAGNNNSIATQLSLTYETPPTPFTIQTGYYVGDGTDNRAITGVGFQADLILIKDDTTTGAEGMIYRSSNMPGELTMPLSQALANLTTNHIQSIDADGFTVGNDADVNTANTIYYWVAIGGSDCSATGTFCVGSYLGNALATKSVADVGFQPDLVVVKRAAALAGIWKSSAMPGTVSNYFDVTAQLAAGGIESLDANGFTVGNNAIVNVDTSLFYYFAFREVPDQLTVGTYTGNGADNRNITSAEDAELTFQPDFVFAKPTSIVTAVASISENYGDRSMLFSDAVSAANHIQALRPAGGFQVGNSTSVNANAVTYYYAALAGTVPKAAGSGSFDIASGSYTGTGAALSITSLGFTPDLVIIKDQSTQQSIFRTSLMSGDRTAYLANAATVIATAITSLDNDGFSLGVSATANTLGGTYYWTAFGNANKPDKAGGSTDFLVGQYIGTGDDNTLVNRLPFTPDLLAIKAVNTTTGMWRTSDQVGDQSLYFTNVALVPNAIQAMSANSFEKGTRAEINTSAISHDYFAFKEGAHFALSSYTGSGVAKNIIDAGLEPSLLWVKKTGLGTARDAVMRSAAQAGNGALPFRNVASTLNAVNALRFDGFTVGTDTTTNENTFVYQYAVWESEDPGVFLTTSSSSPTATAPIPIAIEFRDDVTSFVVGDLVVSNGTAGNFVAVDGSNYTADITPTGQGVVTVNIPAGVAQDSGGKDNRAALPLSVTYDTVGPTMAITSGQTSPTSSSPFGITVEFDENVVGFVVGDITVGGGAAGGFVAVDGNTYTANITPSGQGVVTIDVAGSVAQDGAGNNNSAATQFSMTYDSVAPTVAISSGETSPSNNSPFGVTVEFSENVTGFVVGDITVGNGSAGNFAAVDGNTYTADITPSGQGAVTVDVAGSVAQDAATNNNTAATQLSITYDTVAPTLAISSSEASPTNVSPIEVTFEFSENVTGFVVGEITVGNGSVGNFATVDGNTYTADITPSGQGAVTVDVAGAIAKDAADNDNSAAPQFSITYDTVDPTVAISSGESSPTNASPFEVTIEFNENVTGFVVGDITVGNGSAGNFAAVDGNTYTADITPSGQGAVTVDVAGAIAQDAAGNDNSAATQFSITYDSVAPTVAVTSGESSPTANSPIAVTIEFSENVTGFVVGDLTVGNGSAGNFAAVDGNTYTADITPSGQGAVTVDVAGAVAQDAASNDNSAATQLSITYDTVDPTLVISSAESSPTNVSPIEVTFEFSENVTGFVIGDISVGNGSAGNFAAVDGNTYTADITPSGQGAVTVDVAAAVSQDAAGNDNTIATQFSITYDTVDPTLVISSAESSPTNVSPIEVTFEFSENVTGFVIGDISVGNGSAGNFAAVDGNTYTADITPSGQGVVTVDVAAAVAQDAASNDNTIATQFSITYDTVDPTVVISSAESSPTNVSPIEVTFEFSENVTGFVIGDISVGNGSAGNFAAVDGNTYTADITPSGQGAVTVDVAGAVAQDAASNDNAVATQFSITYDTVDPTLAISSSESSPTNVSPIEVTFEFSENVTGFVIGDISVGNGSAGNFATVDGNTYTADITPSGQGAVTVDVAGAVAQDASGNDNTVATQFSITYDTVDPTVAISSAESSPTNVSPIEVTFEFSENVTGFVIGDISVGNGSAGNFAAVDGNTYTADITPSGQGAVTVDVAAAVAQDAAGNDNTIATQFSITYDTVDPTLVISSAESSPTNVSPIEVTFEFSENVTGFVIGDITVGNGSAGNFAAVDGNTYTADITPSGQGAVTVDVAAAVSQDAAGNDNTIATQFSITYDTVDPTVVISSGESSPTNVSPIEVTFEFSENVTGFVIGDISVGNGSAGNFAAVDGNTYTADITPSGQGAVTVDVAAAIAQDAAGNDNTIATQFSITYDTVNPTLVISSAEASPTNISPIEVTFEFSENVSGFVIGDISVGNGSAGNFAAVDGNTYTADITPGGQGAVTVNVAGAVAQDASGNDNTVATQFSITYDTVDPTVVISSAESSPTNVSPIGVTFEFSENVTGFVIGDISVGNGSVGNFAAVDGNTYTADITPSAQGAVTVNVAGAVAQDAAANDNSAATQFSITFDTVAPTVAVSSGESSPTAATPFAITIEFSENVSGFVVGDITVGNGSAGNFAAVDGNTYTADITPSAQGAVTVDVAGAVAQDAATNDNSAAAQFSITFDTVAPTVAISSDEADPTATSPFEITIEFSEAVTGFVVGDISLGNATIGNFVAVDGNTYTADVTPSAQGGVTVNVAGAVAQDAAGNDNTAAAQFSIVYDSVAPTVYITTTEPDPTNVSPFDITIEFSENVTGFVVGDITASNATLGNFVAVDGNTYLAEVTATSDGVILLDIAASVAQDAAGNDNTAATQFDIVYDSDLPTVVIASAETSPTSASPFVITIEFSEAVTGFTSGDIDAGNATVGNFVAVDSDSYTAELTPLADGVVTADISAGAALDAALSGNVAAAQFSITFDGTVPTVTIDTAADINLANFTAYQVQGSCSENGRDVDITVTSDNGGGPFNSVQVCTALSWEVTADISVLNDGELTIEASHTDLSGNSAVLAQSTITKDTLAPDGPTISSPQSGAVLVSLTSISGAAEANSTVYIYEGITLVATTTANGAGVWATTPSISFSSGEHTIYARATDQAANIGPNSSDTTFSIESNFSVTGSVELDNADHDPLPETIVRLGDYETTTAADGTFEFSSIAPGTYELSGERQGFVIERSEDTASPTVVNADLSGLKLIATPVLVKTLYAPWNGHLQMTNVLELMNTGNFPIELTLQLFSSDGLSESIPGTGEPLQITVPALSQRDFVINDMPGFHPDTYGYIKVQHNAETIDGRVTNYRLANTVIESEFDYVFAIPLSNSLNGTSSVSFNTFYPTTNSTLLESKQVVQWLSLINTSEDEPIRFTIMRYLQDGTLYATERIRLEPSARYDIEGGHESAGKNKIGLIRVVPNNPTAQYISYLSRYVWRPELDEFDFATATLAEQPVANKLHTIIANNDESTNYIEIANPADTNNSIEIRAYDMQGDLLGETPIVLAPHSVHHLSGNPLIPADTVGRLEVESLSHNPLVVQSLNYYINESGVVQSAFSMPGRSAYGMTMFGSFNLYLGTSNTVRLTNLTENITQVIFNYNNTRINESSYDISEVQAFASIDHPITPTSQTANSYGLVTVQTTTPGAVVTEILRSKDYNENIDFRFSTQAR